MNTLRFSRSTISWSAVLMVCLSLSVAASAQAATVKGKVAGGGGYTLLVLAQDGTVTSTVLGTNGKFSLKTPKGAKTVSLQLLKSSGSYFGPVVLGKLKKKALLSLKGGGDLGKIKLKNGFALSKNKLKKKSLPSSGAVKADSKGKPLGAGKLGLVKSGSSSKSSGQVTALADGDGNGGGDGNGSGGGSGGGGNPDGGEDPDLDGIPSTVDADDDGDLVIDSSDPSSGSNSSDGLFSTLYANQGLAINANAGTLSAEQLDQFITSGLNLIFYFDASQDSFTSGNINCLALSYCQPSGGSSIISGISESGPDLPRGALWTSYDLDGDGLPNLESITSRDVFAMSLIPSVGSSAIHAGDTFQASFSGGGSATETKTVTLSPYLATVPMIQSYDTGSGPVTLSPTDGSNISIPASGKLKLTFWRPQRLPVSGADIGSFVDAGHLHYGLNFSTQTQEFGCKTETTDLSSTLSEGAATEDSMFNELFPLIDSADDAASNPANTLSFTVDVRACMARNGVSASDSLRASLTASGEPRRGGADRAALSLNLSLE